MSPDLKKIGNRLQQKEPADAMAFQHLGPNDPGSARRIVKPVADFQTRNQILTLMTGAEARGTALNQFGFHADLQGVVKG